MATTLQISGGSSGTPGSGSGDVTGPSSSVDNAIVRFNGTTGKIIQDYTSGAPTIDDTGQVLIPLQLQVGSPDAILGPLNGGIFLNPADDTVGPSGAFITGGARVVFTANSTGDAFWGIRPFNNEQGIDFWNSNAGGDSFIDNRYVRRASGEQIQGSRLTFRMNTGGNSDIGPTGTPIYLMTLSSGGTASGGGMVGIGTGAPLAGLDVKPMVNAQSAQAYGVRLSQVINAVANSDTLNALIITPSFIDNAKTGVIHNGLIITDGHVGFGTLTPASTLPNGFTAAGRILTVYQSGVPDAGIRISSFSLSAQGMDLWTKNSDGANYLDSRLDSAASVVNFRTRTAGTPVTNLILLGNGTLKSASLAASSGLSNIVFASDTGVLAPVVTAVYNSAYTGPNADEPARPNLVYTAGFAVNQTLTHTSTSTDGAQINVTYTPTSNASSGNMRGLFTTVHATGSFKPFIVSGHDVYAAVDSGAGYTAVQGATFVGTTTAAGTGTAIIGVFVGAIQQHASGVVANVISLNVDPTNGGVRTMAGTISTALYGVSITGLSTASLAGAVPTRAALYIGTMASTATADYAILSDATQPIKLASTSLLLASGAILNWNAGVATITQNAQNLTLAGSGSMSLFITSGLVSATAHVGGGNTTSTISIYPTYGAGTTGADIIFAGGTNGGTEWARFPHGGGLSIGVAGTLGGTLTLQGSTSGTGTIRVSAAAGSAVLTLPTATGTLATLAGTETFTNKRVTRRVQSVSNAATITPNADSDDLVDITAIAQTFTVATPSGTPTNAQGITVRIKDDGTARAITWGAGYVAGGVALPASTVISKIVTCGFIYNTANSLNKWMCVGVAQET